jgi:hypothetical protein
MHPINTLWVASLSTLPTHEHLFIWSGLFFWFLPFVHFQMIDKVKRTLCTPPSPGFWDTGIAASQKHWRLSLWWNNSGDKPTRQQPPIISPPDDPRQLVMRYHLPSPSHRTHAPPLPWIEACCPSTRPLSSPNMLCSRCRRRRCRKFGPSSWAGCQCH